MLNLLSFIQATVVRVPLNARTLTVAVLTLSHRGKEGCLHTDGSDLLVESGIFYVLFKNMADK